MSPSCSNKRILYDRVRDALICDSVRAQNSLRNLNFRVASDLQHLWCVHMWTTEKKVSSHGEMDSFKNKTFSIATVREKMHFWSKKKTLHCGNMFQAKRRKFRMIPASILDLSDFFHRQVLQPFLLRVFHGKPQIQIIRLRHFAFVCCVDQKVQVGHCPRLIDEVREEWAHKTFARFACAKIRKLASIHVKESSSNTFISRRHNNCVDVNGWLIQFENRWLLHSV